MKKRVVLVVNDDTERDIPRFRNMSKEFDAFYKNKSSHFESGKFHLMQWSNVEVSEEVEETLHDLQRVHLGHCDVVIFQEDHFLCDGEITRWGYCVDNPFDLKIKYAVSFRPHIEGFYDFKKM